MRRHWLLLLIGLLAAALAIGAVACGDDEENGGEEPTATEELETPEATDEGAETPVEGASTVNVDLTEYAITLDVASVPAGPVTFNATNSGEEHAHELVIIKTDLAPDALPTAADGSVDEAGAGIEVIDEIEEFDPGGEESLTVDLEAGAYVLICNVVSEMEDGETHVHYAEGMTTAFEVTE